MAVFPQGLSQIDARCNTGERRLLHQLKRCLEDDYIVWHDVPIGPRARQPDFVILSPRWGVLLLEVKDWKRATLGPANRDAVELLTPRGRVTQPHPLRQARDFMMELVDLMKSKPGQLNYASAGVGSTTHLAMEMLKSVSNTYALHIPYNGNGPAGTALIAGQVEILFGSLPALLPHSKSGRARALAVGTPKRSASLPDVPTVAESGYPGFDASLWLALFAPAGTPAPIVARLQKEVAAAVSAPDTRETLDKNGAEPLTSTPAELAAMMKDGVGKYAKVVKSAGVKPE